MSCSKKCWVAISVIILLAMSLVFGKMLDQRAQVAVEKLYGRNADGIIQGTESKAVIKHYPNALLLLHGFGTSPEVFGDFIAAAQASHGKFDIYAPLLPYHGRDLQTFANLNNEKIIQFVATEIKQLSTQYKSVTVLGFSYSGAVLVALLKQHAIPENVKVILYAPSINIKGNNFSGDLLLNTYALWRKYCNYLALGCSAVSYSSGDDVASAFLARQKTLRYTVTPAVKQLYQLDKENREYFAQTKQPFDLIIAQDDNHMLYTQMAAICHANPQCVLHAFPSGRHYVLLGKYKDVFNELVMQLVEKNTKR